MQQRPLHSKRHLNERLHRTALHGHVPKEGYPEWPEYASESKLEEVPPPLPPPPPPPPPKKKKHEFFRKPPASILDRGSTLRPRPITLQKQLPRRMRCHGSEMGGVSEIRGTLPYVDKYSGYLIWGLYYKRIVLCGGLYSGSLIFVNPQLGPEDHVGRFLLGTLQLRERLRIMTPTLNPKP